MNIALFYNLRERLRASAVSGCDVIKEDFRLKRAVEEFEPLASANKVFGKLYAMCNELFTSEKSAPLLADCIALCEALAVTQGTFNDNSETSEYVGVVSCEPTEIRYSLFKEEDIVSKDPRAINKCLRFIKSRISENGKNFIISFGKDLVPELKNRLDLTNPQENGAIVKYIGLMAGADENNWYISLIENENNPLAVRIQAVNNLMYDESNADRLLELYKTGKATVKDAAAMALVQLDVPEAEIILKKVTSGKFAKKNAELILVSRNKIAVDFAVDYAEKWIEERKNNPKATKFVYNYELAIQMLANKTDVEDILNKIAEYTSGSVSIAEMLVVNLCRHKDEGYRTLIENLYKRNPEYFTMPYLFMIMTEDRGVELTDLPEIVDEYRYSLLFMFTNISCDFVRKCFTIYPQFSRYHDYSGRTIKVPLAYGKIDKIIDIMSDTSYLKTPMLKLKLKNYKSYAYDHNNKLKGDKYVNECVFWTSQAFNNLYRQTYYDDEINALAVAFYKEAMKYSPREDIFLELCKHDVQYIRENPDLLENTIMFQMENFDGYVREGYLEYVPKDVLDIVIPIIYIKLKTMKTVKVKKQTLSYQIHAIERFMKNNGYDKDKILKGNE